MYDLLVTLLVIDNRTSYIGFTVYMRHKDVCIIKNIWSKLS